MKSKISQAAQKKWALLRLNRRSGLFWMGELAAQEDARLFLVGGAVRDKLLGKKTCDIDLACDGNVHRVGERFATELDSTFLYHKEFQTGTLEGPKGERIDIALTRSETYPEPGHLPKIEAASIDEDLYRRDFTVNAVAQSLFPDVYGRIIDPLGGRTDIKMKLIRVIHDRSFIDDPTRIFRAARYSERLGFRIAPRTLELLKKSVVRVKGLSGERLLYELKCIAREETQTRIRIIKKLAVLGVLEFLGKPSRSLATGLLARIPAEETCWFLCFFLSFFKGTYVRKLPLKKACIETIKTLRDSGKILANLKSLRKPSEVTFHLNNYDTRGLEIIAQVEKSQSVKKINDYLKSYLNVKIATTGDDLKSLGLAPGPSYRKLTNMLLAARLDGKVRTKREEQALLKRLAGKE